MSEQISELVSNQTPEQTPEQMPEQVNTLLTKQANIVMAEQVNTEIPVLRHKRKLSTEEVPVEKVVKTFSRAKKLKGNKELVVFEKSNEKVPVVDGEVGGERHHRVMHVRTWDIQT